MKRKATTTRKATAKKRKTVGALTTSSRFPAALRSKRPEVKSVDVNAISAVISSAGTFTWVNQPVEGTSYYQRIGRQIEMQSLHLTGYLTFNSTSASTTEDYIRIMVVYDRNTNGALPNTADLILNQNAAGTTTTTGLDHLNLNNRDRFMILRDQRIYWPGTTNSATGSLPTFQGAVEGDKATFMITHFIKLNNLLCEYKASAGAITDVSSGALYVFYMSYNNQAVTFNFTTRLRYKD